MCCFTTYVKIQYWFTCETFKTIFLHTFITVSHMKQHCIFTRVDENWCVNDYVSICILKSWHLISIVGNWCEHLMKLQDVPIFISWLRYFSFNYHTYRLLLKVQYETISPVIDGIKLDSGLKEATALGIMVFGYRFLAYLSLRRMKVGWSNTIN